MSGWNDRDPSSARRVVLVELVETAGAWRPHRVETEHACYDFEWCTRDGVCYYDDVGTGGYESGGIYVDTLCAGARGRLWIAPTHWPYRNGDPEHRRLSPEEVSALGWDLLEEQPADPFAEAEESDTRWCLTCNDALPEQNLCSHVWYCETDGWWRGATDSISGRVRGPCRDRDCWECSRERERRASG